MTSWSVAGVTTVEGGGQGSGSGQGLTPSQVLWTLPISLGASWSWETAKPRTAPAHPQVPGAGFKLPRT